MRDYPSPSPFARRTASARRLSSRTSLRTESRKRSSNPIQSAAAPQMVAPAKNRAGSARMSSGQSLQLLGSKAVHGTSKTIATPAAARRKLAALSPRTMTAGRSRSCPNASSAQSGHLVDIGLVSFRSLPVRGARRRRADHWFTLAFSSVVKVVKILCQRRLEPG